MVFFNGVSILLRWIEIGRKRVGSPQRERERGSSREEKRGLSQALQTRREDFEERKKMKRGSVRFMPLCCHTAAVSAPQGWSRQDLKGL